MSKEKKMVIAALCGLIVVIIAIILLIPSCNAGSGAPENDAAIEKTDTAGKETEKNDVTAKSTLDSAKENASKDAEDIEPIAGNAPTSDSSGSSASSNSEGSTGSVNPPDTPKMPGGASGSSESKPDPKPSKKWVSDYKKVWIEDSAAWDEQVPIYGKVEISVCNTCGAEITDNEARPRKGTHARWRERRAP